MRNPNLLLLCGACGVIAACAPMAPRVARERAAPSASASRHAGGAQSPQSWFADGAATAHANLAGPARARNLIVFLGDGMSIATITAARILDGQRKGAAGEENRLSFERFPATALARTYETDYQTPDSAGTMTAIMSGVKTRDGVIGIDQVPARGDCAATRGHERVTLLELAEVAGLATGVVTTARVTHATPAATYGHLPERGWEDDSELPPSARAEGCIDFARQLVEFPFGDGLDVVLGGGRRGFLPTTQADPEHASETGRREDGRDLVAEWRERTGGRHVWDRAGFDAVDPARTSRLLGLFEPGHMRYEHERASDAGGEPDLAAMTRTALALLARNPRGYVLMVEGGRIDHAHHAGNAYRALDETIEFAEAVQAAVDATSADDTLILVTADHSHTLTFAGYPARGNPILGKVRDAHGELARDATGLPYTTLGYANGPGHAGASDVQGEGPKRYPHAPGRQAAAAAGRPDLSEVDTGDPDYLQEATMPLGSESHGGDDVAVYARGPGADGVRGSLEQNVLFHLLVQSAPALRAVLCELDRCDADGTPVRLPDHAALLRRDAGTAAR
ncbi:MAG: alkaline phosphatase [Lysobacteraceae bacterium]|nr:MAG: alkaline phosphatase [Xanthomonadaceae bacterium]